MHKLFIFSTTLFLALFFSAKSFALHVINHPKKEGFDQKELKVYNRVLFDNFFEDKYSASDSKNEYDNYGARFDLISRSIYKNWFFYFNYRVQEAPSQSSELERVRSNGAGNQFYENHFGLTRELYLGYENDDFLIYGGKFRPAFGESWVLGRGIWTQDISVNYMQLERLGVGGALKRGSEKEYGAYKFGFAAYTKDTKNLDNSQITTRDAFDKSNGNVGEGRSLGSYTAYMDVNYDFGGAEKLFYRFAYSNLDVNSNQALNRLDSNKIQDQNGYTVTMIYNYPFKRNFSLNYLAEYANIKNVNGDGDVSDQYFNSSAIFRLYKNWNVTAGYANRKNMNAGENGYDEYFSEISAGYSFFNNVLFDKLTIQVGNKASRVNFKSSVDKRRDFGLLIRYVKWF